MKKLASVLSGIALATALVTAQAADKGSVTGVISEVNAADHAIVLEDGTTLTLADGINMGKLYPGKEVTVTYEMKGNDKIGTNVELKKDGD